MHTRALFVIAIGLVPALVAAAQDRERPDLTIGRLSAAPPVIDGVVDDEVWTSVPPFSRFIQQEPDEAIPQQSGPRFGFC